MNQSTGSASMINPFITPTLTRRRIWLALVLALGADAIQIALGPLGWAFFDEVVDVFAMIATTALLGFHPLLLPTFVVEFIPVVDMLPTWTGCVGVVILLRKRQQREAGRPPGSGPVPPVPKAAEGETGPIIDV